MRLGLAMLRQHGRDLLSMGYQMWKFPVTDEGEPLDETDDTEQLQESCAVFWVADRGEDVFQIAIELYQFGVRYRQYVVASRMAVENVRLLFFHRDELDQMFEALVALWVSGNLSYDESACPWCFAIRMGDEALNPRYIKLVQRWEDDQDIALALLEDNNMLKPDVDVNWDLGDDPEELP